MDDVEDASSVGNSDEGAPPTNGTAGVLEDEGRDTAFPLGNSSVPNRYREILRKQRDQASEDGSSVDNAPRRADSPMGSALSVPDDAASIQVWWPPADGPPGLLTRLGRAPASRRQGAASSRP